jgi:hypothetical protein
MGANGTGGAHPTERQKAAVTLESPADVDAKLTALPRAAFDNS